MQAIYHANETRGAANHGWLVSRHTFSFADYVHPDRMNFGLLRVLNDDIVHPSRGFDTHPHANMEIVSIPLSGSLKHQDSMGNTHIISAGEVQVLSAGTGVTHSEYNNSPTENVSFLQIWVIPREKNITPHYAQKGFDPAEQENRFQLLVTPDGAGETALINQDAWFSMARIQPGHSVHYVKKGQDTGVYFFVIHGEATIGGHRVEQRDGLGLMDVEEIAVDATRETHLLAIEVPL